MAKDLRQETIDTYNKSAKELAEYFRGIRSRKQYVDMTLDLIGNPPNPRIVEVGCGDGRDSKYVVTRTTNYTGFDISEKLIELARLQVPDANFQIADAVTFTFPKDTDIVLSFASLLHLDKTEVQCVFQNAAAGLRPGGVFYISTKYRPKYESEVKDDEYGRRLFYFYTPEVLSELAGKDYECIKVWHEIRGHTDWLEMILQKVHKN